MVRTGYIIFMMSAFASLRFVAMKQYVQNFGSRKAYVIPGILFGIKSTERIYGNREFAILKRLIHMS